MDQCHTEDDVVTDLPNGRSDFEARVEGCVINAVVDRRT